MSSDGAPSTTGGYDTSKLKLKAFSNAAAGHDGVLSDESGEVLIKPCTAAEIAFYQASASEHPDFYDLMPTMMGTLQLGPPPNLPSSAPAELTQEFKDQTLLHGKALQTSTAIVLANLEHGFIHPNVLDLKLGARLYDPTTTSPDKAARLDKVSSATTSGSLHYRIAGMKVWSAAEQAYTVYDKFYGRQFTPDTIHQGYEAFFAGLLPSPSSSSDPQTPQLPARDARALLELVLADISRARQVLSRSCSRMYGASVLVVCEGDASALASLLSGSVPEGLSREEVVAPTREAIAEKDGEDEVEEEEEEEEEEKVAYRVKMIDFAHAAWVGEDEGPDGNVLEGLRNVEGAMEGIIGRFV